MCKHIRFSLKLVYNATKAHLMPTQTTNQITVLRNDVKVSKHKGGKCHTKTQRRKRNLDWALLIISPDLKGNLQNRKKINVKKLMPVCVRARVLTVLWGNGVLRAGWRSRLGAVSARAVEGISAGPRSFWIKPASQSKSQLLPGWLWLRTGARANQSWEVWSRPQ